VIFVEHLAGRYWLQHGEETNEVTNRQTRVVMMFIGWTLFVTPSGCKLLSEVKADDVVHGKCAVYLWRCTNKLINLYSFLIHINCCNVCVCACVCVCVRARVCVCVMGASRTPFLCFKADSMAPVLKNRGYSHSRKDAV